MARLDTMLDKINSGQGTIGQLLKNPSLYETLDGTTREMHGLLKDFRANPKKFLTHQAEDFLACRRRLVVNADDFGFTRDVNQGIIEAHRDGILTATTLMAHRRRVRRRRAAGEGKSQRSMSGCHLVLVGGAADFRRAFPQLMRAVALGGFAIYDELARRCGGSSTRALQPTHLDTHKHTHLLPPVLDAVARISEEFGIPWVRRPFDFPTAAGIRRQ